MNKNIQIIIAIIAVLLIGGAFYFSKNKNTKNIEEVKNVQEQIVETPIQSSTYSSPLILSLSTDKTKYTSNEPITFKLKAHNPTDKNITLHYETSCMIKYLINTFDSSKDRKCAPIGELPGQIIEAGTDETWEFTHLPKYYQIPEGEQNVRIEIQSTEKNIPPATTIVTIIKTASVKVTPQAQVSSTNPVITSITPNPLAFGRNDAVYLNIVGSNLVSAKERTIFIKNSTGEVSVVMKGYPVGGTISKDSASFPLSKVNQKFTLVPGEYKIYIQFDGGETSNMIQLMITN